MTTLNSVSLQIALTWLRYHELRAIITNLQLGRGSGDNNKAGWIETLCHLWATPQAQADLLDRLSPPALAALHRLCMGGTLPATLFWATYGSIRLPGDASSAAVARPDEDDWLDVQDIPGAEPPDDFMALPSAALAAVPRPWLQPITAAEELFYSGLLFPGTNQPIRKAQRIGLPGEILGALAILKFDVPHHPLARFAPPAATLTAAPVPLPKQPPALLHDLAQWLIYLHQQPHLPLQQGRWLAPRHLRALNQRLQRPVSAPLRSHKSSAWLAFLAFLSSAADLQQNGQLTATGHQWLGDPPALQLRCLWESWLQSSHTLRRAYGLPAAHLPATWLDHAVDALAEGIFRPTWLSAVILHREEAWQGLYVAYLTDLHELDRQHAQLLALLATWFDAVQPARLPQSAQLLPPLVPPLVSDEPSASLAAQGSEAAILQAALARDDGALVYDQPPAVLATFRLTALGQWLLETEDAPTPTWQWAVQATLTATETHCLVTLPATADPLAQAYLAPFARYQPAHAAHHYHLDEAAVAGAAAARVGLPTLWEALARLHLTLAPPVSVQVQQWYHKGEQLQLTLLPLLRTQSAPLMAQLQANRALRKYLGEVLTPTVAVWHGEAAAFTATLVEQGFYPDRTPPPTPPRSQGGELSAPPPSPAAIGALWLAAELYTTLGRFLPLPMTLPHHLLTQWFVTLSPQQQAQLQAQLAHQQAQLATLLDDLPFTPPPEPSDPAAWIPLIDTALDRGQSLQMSYFSAGRNLTTQRLVEPYWREAHRGVPYLRAYCHSAGRVLTFRLDRIETLVFVP